MADGPKNIWFEKEDMKPTALELYETIMDKQYPNEEGTNIFYFPKSDIVHYGYGVEFIENPYKGSMAEEFLYTVFKRTDIGQLTNSNEKNNKDKNESNQNFYLFFILIFVLVSVCLFSVPDIFYCLDQRAFMF
eukprot:510751_1